MSTIMSPIKILLTQRTRIMTTTTLRSVLRRKPYTRQSPQRTSRVNTAAMFSSTTATSAAHHDPKVGFIGLGNMGLPMATNLAKEFPVVVFDVNPDACDKAAAVAATASSSSQAKESSSTSGTIEIAKSIDEIGALSVQDCPVIVTMLPGCATVNSVMDILTQSTSNATGNSLGRVIVDCSTVSPTTSRKWHQVWQQQGHAMLDAPVSGGVKGATDGTLTFMVGCSDDEEKSLEKALPYLNVMGQRVMHCGKEGTGSATKLCNNLALAAQMLGICEAMNLGEALGVDPIVLADVMNTSTAKCWSSQVNNPHPAVATASGTGAPASKDYQGGFGTKLMLKDLGLATEVAKELHVGLPITSMGKELYQLADLRGLGDKDFGVLLQFLRGK